MRVGQSARAAKIESATSTVVGLCIALGTNYVVLHVQGHEVSFLDVSSLTGAFTALSFIRQYGIRRLFNWLFETGKLE